MTYGELLGYPVIFSQQVSEAGGMFRAGCNARPVRNVYSWGQCEIGEECLQRARMTLLVYEILCLFILFIRVVLKIMVSVRMVVNLYGVVCLHKVR